MSDLTPDSESYEIVNKSDRDSSGEESSSRVETVQSKTSEEGENGAEHDVETTANTGGTLGFQNFMPQLRVTLSFVFGYFFGYLLAF